MKLFSCFRVIFAVTLCCSASAKTQGFLSPPEPAYIPNCYSPQQIAPIQPAGGESMVTRSALAWNGREYGMVYLTNSTSSLDFRRFFADGTPVGPPVSIGPAELAPYLSPAIAWNGTNYGVAWTYWEDPYEQVNFALLSPTGTILSGPTRVSFYGGAPMEYSDAATLASNGNGFAVAWEDYRNGTADIYATLLNSDGSVAGEGAFHDIAVSSAVGDQEMPTIAWSPARQVYLLAFGSDQSGTHREIYGATLSPTGGWSSSLGVLASAGTTDSEWASLAGSPAGLGLTWYDNRDANWEIYFQLLSPAGALVGPPQRLTNDSAYSYYPRAAWTGSEFGVFWDDNRTGHYEIWFQRVSASGNAVGGNVQATFSSGSHSPDGAFGRYGYLVSFDAQGSGNEVMAWGCAADLTPPSCPGGFVAYNITGTTATIGWLPSGEDASDVAYYIVYRNAVPIAQTSATLYADSGLALNATYAYAVEPVNAAQLQNYACQTTFYVKSNATLTLMVTKDANGADAALAWTDASMADYNVFRGTSPQVMVQIGATGGQAYADPGVLLDGNIYYYTVDEPGW